MATTTPEDPGETMAALSGPTCYLLRFSRRFWLLYVVLYSAPQPLAAASPTRWLSGAVDALWATLIPWVGRHVLRLAEPISLKATSSGDRTADYARLVAIIALALPGAALWALRPATRELERRMLEGLRVYVRYVVGCAMLLYGVAKLFPIQFGPLGPHTLDATIGEASRQQVLWYFMGVSAPYAFAGGVAEVVGGMLLFWRRTALLGALIVAMVMTNVVLLNFCYDVCVKQYSSHLLLMTGFLLAPDARRVLDYLGRGGRDAAPSHLFTSRRTQLMAAVSRGVLICSVWLSLANFVRSAYDNGRIGSASKPPYHGTWLVERFERASTLVPACASEARRWERVLIENHIFTTVTMDRTRRSYRFDYDAGKSTLALKDREATFGTLHAAGSGSELRLHGVLVDDDIQVALRRVPESQFRPLEPLQWIHERSD